jgi:hypothetical protein
MPNNKMGEVSPSLQPPSNLTANNRAFSATPSCPNKLAKTAIFLILLTAVCVRAEWKFDNDPDVQERGDKRDEEREQARKALDRVRFGVKVGGFGGLSAFGDGYDGVGLDGGIMLNIPLSRLNNGNLVIATELNYGYREGGESEETYLSVPLMLQYVSFFYPTTDIQVHWVKSPKRHVFMHLKTIMEAGAFIDIPLESTGRENTIYGPSHHKDYKDRNSFDLGGMVGYAFQLENIILGLRAAASHTDFGGYYMGNSSVLLQGKLYLGYLF